MCRILERKAMAIWADTPTLSGGTIISIVLLSLTTTQIKSFGTLLVIIEERRITACYDGTLARKANDPSWISKNEILFDFSMIMAGSIYLLSSFPLPWFVFCPNSNLANPLLLCSS